MNVLASDDDSIIGNCAVNAGRDIQEYIRILKCFVLSNKLFVRYTVFPPDNS